MKKTIENNKASIEDLKRPSSPSLVNISEFRLSKAVPNN